MTALRQLVVLVLGAGVLHAEPLKPAIRLVETSTAASPPPLHVFGGDSLSLSAAIDAPIGSRVTISGDLVQVAGGLSVALRKNLPLGRPREFLDRTHATAQLEVEMPAVKRVTQAVIVLRALDSSCEQRIVVYPRDFLKPLVDEFKVALAGAGGKLILCGRSAALRAFLKENEIPFQDAGANFPPAVPKGALVLCVKAPDAPLPATTEALAANLIIFCGDARLLPGVYSTVRGKWSTVKVTLPILEGLSRNPKNQRLLAGVIGHTLGLQTSQFIL